MNHIWYVSQYNLPLIYFDNEKDAFDYANYSPNCDPEWEDGEIEGGSLRVVKIKVGKENFIEEVHEIEHSWSK